MLTHTPEDVRHRDVIESYFLCSHTVHMSVQSINHMMAAEVSEELSESEAGSEEQAAVCSSQSLIDRLKCRPRSDLSRKRKVEKSLQESRGD